MIRIPGYYDLPEEYYRKGCATGGTVKTADGKYLLAKLSGKSMNMNRIEMLGGIVDAEPEIRTGHDLFGAFYKELQEEALITEEDIHSCVLRALLLGERTTVILYFEAELNVSADEIIARQLNNNLDHEVDALAVLSRQEYLSTLQDHTPVKQLIATLVSI